MIKLAAIGCLIVVAVIMGATLRFPHGAPAGIANLWNDNGFFATGFMGLVSGFQIAFFAYIGVELVGAAAAETADPTRTLPRAIDAVPVRVAIFYIGALLAILAVVPWRQFSSGQSPFVMMFSWPELPQRHLWSTSSSQPPPPPQRTPGCFPPDECCSDWLTKAAPQQFSGN